MPATLARMSRRPWRSSTCHGGGTGRRVGDVADDAVRPRRTISHPTTAAPSSAKRAATASPMPLAAPETSATLPSNRPMAAIVVLRMRRPLL